MPVATSMVASDDEASFRGPLYIDSFFSVETWDKLENHGYTSFLTSQRFIIAGWYPSKFIARVTGGIRIAGSIPIKGLDICLLFLHIFQGSLLQEYEFIHQGLQ